MPTAATAAQANHLRALHHAEEPLVLANVWDPMSALLVAEAGAAAVATTSGGVAWAHGLPDGEHLPIEPMLDVVAAIAGAMDVPVSADVEGGYGDVAATVAAVVERGAAGINLEDRVGDGLRSAEDQAARLGAARDAGAALGVEVVINARTDVFLAPGGSRSIDEVADRATTYAEAGADCLFVPGVVDVATVAQIVERCPLPVNVMAGPGAPTVAELAAVGVRRISVGGALAQAAYGAARAAARELLGPGTYGSLDAAPSFAELNALVTGRIR